ncbi:retrovirus-related pol polyprotein from transposon TNT 1-94 [Tanacetum coccineum]
MNVLRSAPTEFTNNQSSELPQDEGNKSFESGHNGWEDPVVTAMKGSFSDVTKSSLNVVRDSNSLVDKDSHAEPKLKIKFRSFFNIESVEDSDCVLPLANIQAVKHKFENTLVGYFVGNGVAFPLVKNYVTNTWSKFGFKKIIRDEEDFFFIKFDSINGVEQVLEQGTWMIRNTPFILNKWTPNLSLCKDKVTNVQFGSKCIECL